MKVTVNARRAGLGLALVVGASLVAAPVRPADESPRRMQIELIVSRISDEPGEIDPRGAEIHRTIQREFRYQSLSVVSVHELSLELGEAGSVLLPNGKRVRVQPMLIDERGALVAVEVEGSVQADLRVKNGRLVVIGAERHENGKLVIALEPRF